VSPPTGTALGFYGKVSTHGDFVSRRLPRTFLDPWDSWLQECLRCTHEQLGDAWLDIYLTSPVWRFGLAAGVCGDSAWTGVIMPGVDRVGRYFPLTVAAALPPGSSAARVLLDAGAWLSALERLALSSLDDAFELERFDRAVEALGPAPASPATGGQPPPAREAPAWQFTLAGPLAETPVWATLATGLLEALMPHHSVWSTAGSDRVHPSLALCRGLPPVGGYAALMDGDWSRWGWQSRGDAPLRVAPSARASGPAPDSAPEQRWVSAHATHTGRVRDHNEDALLDSPALRLWAVADGMGGHAEGSVASAAVARALAEVEGAGGLETRVAAARAAVARANRELRERARAHPWTDVIGSTVVTLVAEGDRVACLWAGDSRAYLYREQRLTAVTHDHNVLEELLSNGQFEPSQAATFEGGNALTRAVGGADELQLDEVRLAVRPGDLFLLCSDGLTREVPDAEIAQALADPDLRRACDALVARAVEHGGRDNVTVVAVRAPG
jgi:type VI secretion system protein ImpM